MRLVLLCCISAVLGIAATRVGAPSADSKSEVTIILDFQGEYSDESLGEMKREVASLMKGSGFTFDWRLRSENTSDPVSNLILVKLTGDCLLDPAREISEQPGPLALAHTSGNTVLRFAEAHCNAVGRLVSKAANSQDNGNVLFGRALGRVLAHEFCHILGNTFGHSEDGVLRSSLSGRQLIARHFDIDPADLDRLRFHH